ncbi:MAG: PRC-barrel domain containing protein [Bradyrhizobium sp.]|nr:MAG: PRC-barrel domain containing protein [Bradyrhizobium sp.]
MRNFLLAAAAISAFSVAAALAQNAPNNANDTNASPPAAANPNAMAPPINAPKAPPFKNEALIEVPNTDQLSSNLVGLDVYDDQHHDVGKIKDVAFDESKKINAYIVSVGGVLGVGARYVAVSPDAIAVAYDAGNHTWRASIGATVDQLKAGPQFKYDGQWNASRS